MKAETLAELPDAIVSACLASCRGDGAATRETMRHIYAALERPMGESSARLLARLHEALENSLCEGVAP